MSPRWRRTGLEGLFVVLFVSVVVEATAAAGNYQTVEIDGLRVTIDSEWAGQTAPGYLPVRFDVTNLGEARVIEIAGQGTRYFRVARTGVQAGLEARQTVRLARGDRVRLTIPVPIFADNENIRFEILEDGHSPRRFNFSGFQSGILPGSTSALIVADPASEFGKSASGWPRSFGVPPSVIPVPLPSSPRSVPLLDFVLSPERLPANWLGFTSVRAVVIGPREWEQLSEAQKSALLTWTACGGDLMFVGGNLQTLFPEGRRGPSITENGAVAKYFFGHIHLPTLALVSGMGFETALSVADGAVQDANWALPANRAFDWGRIEARGFRLPIPGVDGVPARAYLSILIVFSLLIGPVNYWVLWRKRRQALLVLTAPMISGIFIALLGGYVLFGEGFGVRGRAVTFTRLDQVSKQASTRATVSLYAAGRTPAGGLNFPRDVAVFPIGADGRGRRDRQTLDLTASQRFSAGAIQARSPTNFEQIGFRPARERLGFSRDADGLVVVNGLGVAVARLFYRDGNTTYGLAEVLPPGGKGRLRAVTFDPRKLIPADVPFPERFRDVAGSQPDGSYLAVLQRSPFWEAGVANVDERGSFHLVLGALEVRP